MNTVSTSVVASSSTPSKPRSSSSEPRAKVWRVSLYPQDLPVTVNKRLTTAAVTCGTSLLHTQLEDREEDESTTQVVLVRLADLDPGGVSTAGNTQSDITRALWNALFVYSAKGSSSPSKFLVELPLPSTLLHIALLQLGAIHRSPNYEISRSALFQLYHYGSCRSIAPTFPYEPVTSKSGLICPLRAPKSGSGSTVYSRVIPHLSAFFNLTICTPNDLPILHEWLNNKRVDEFWMEAGTYEQHEKFLQERTDDPHVLPVIGSYVPSNSSGIPIPEPATYHEIYWVKEDVLGFLIKDQVRDYDRGIHMLVGSETHRGPHRVRAWMASIVHFCFLDDARTERVICEPNARNNKIITYMESVGFVRHGDVTFPHKTAALMVVDRVSFYSKCPF